MKKLVIITFILILTTTLFAQDFTLKLKSSFDDKPIFNFLQYSSWVLIDLDMVCTYKSIWQYGGRIREVNPFWRSIIDKPPLVFTVTTLINVGIFLGTSKLYKKNKFLAYVIIVAVNIVEIYCINTHFKAWRRLR